MTLKDLGYKNCRYCDKEIKLKITRDISRKKFCSISCKTNYNLEYGTLSRKGLKHSKETIIKIKKSKVGKHIGINNPNYKHGKFINN